MGASSRQSAGLYFQWGSIVGHEIAEGYDFNHTNYVAEGLNSIQSDLDDAHDAARAYYGPKAKMPSNANYQELIDNCVLSIHNRFVKFTSNINGASITIPFGGSIVGTTVYGEDSVLRTLKIALTHFHCL